MTQLALKIILQAGLFLDIRGNQPVEQMSDAHEAGHEHCLLFAIDSLYAPPSNIFTLQAMLVRIFLAHGSRVDGRCTEVALHCCGHEVGKGDLRVFNRE